MWKTYLLPDSGKSTKRKTKIVKKSLNPVFNELVAVSAKLANINALVSEVVLFNSLLSVARYSWLRRENLGVITFMLMSC